MKNKIARGKEVHLFFNKNKTANIISDKPILTIIIILVIIAVLILIFKVNLPGLVKKFPSFGSSSDSSDEGEVVVERILVKCEGEPVGNVLAAEEQKTWSIIEKEKQFIEVNGEKTKLFWAFKEKELRLHITGLRRKVVVGEIIDEKIIKIYPSFLNSESEDFLKYKDSLPSLDVLKILNNTYRFFGNELCKFSIEESEDEK